jgi:small GTP-binding protein
MEPLLRKFKVLIIGDSCVGKTSILRRHVDGKFSEESAGTIGVDYRANTYIRDGRRYDLQVWDTAGQERFRNVTRAYYRDANAALLVFDLGSHKSFTSIPDWYHQLHSQTGRQSGDMVIILIGNKSDLDVHNVNMTEIQEMASTLNISTYIQTSAKDGERVNEVFDQLLEKLITKGDPGVVSTDVISLGAKSHKSKSSCCGT